MKNITYNSIDAILLPWARDHDFHVFTEFKEEETREMIVVDATGNQFGIYAIPDWENDNKTVAVGADLDKRGGKKHTFYRERKQYHFRKSVDLDKLGKALEEALEVTKAWGAKINETASFPKST